MSKFTKETKPNKKKSKFYLTTAIDYTNAAPHIGHAYEKIVADVQARFHRLLGEDVFFLTGTDEHGQKVERAAKKAGKSPQEFVDGIVARFKELLKVLNISNDDFIRTTSSKHIKLCQDIFNIVHKKGDIYKGKYEGLYCTGCERFFVERELENGNCPVHKRPVENLKEESYFFRMSKYQEALIKHIKENPESILPDFRRKEILERLKEPLKDLSVSRTSFKWGIPLPIDKNHIIYVWFDALLNYVTGIDYPGEKFKKYWPADCHHIGKDILWFHTVIWPCILLAAGIQLPKTVFAHGFVNVKGTKLSKSSGFVVDPFDLANKFGADPIRYFFIKEIPFGEDGDFSEQALISRINGELADDLGNLVNRISVLIQKNFNGKIPKQGKLEKLDKDLIKNIDTFKEIKKEFLKHNYNSAITKTWNVIKETNKYITETEPWNEKDEKRKATVIYNSAEALRIITILISPFIPETSDKIRKQFGFKEEDFSKLKFSNKLEGEIKKANILFKKFEIKEEKQELPLDLKVAKILDVQDHPDADKLYVFKIDLGKEKRQIVAGIKEFYKKDELKGKHIVVVANLKHSKLRGIESQGMLLAACKYGDKGNEIEDKLLLAPKSRPGDKVFFENFASKPKKELGFKEFQKIKMTTTGKKVVHNGSVLKTSKEDISVDIGDGCLVS